MKEDVVVLFLLGYCEGCQAPQSAILPTSWSLTPFTVAKKKQDHHIFSHVNGPLTAKSGRDTLTSLVSITGSATSSRVKMADEIVGFFADGVVLLFWTTDCQRQWHI